MWGNIHTFIKGGVSLKIFFLHLWTDFDENLVSYAKSRKNTIGVEFFKITSVVLEILAFFCQKIDFLPKNSQTFGTFSQTTSTCRIILFVPSCSSDQYKTMLGSFFWISNPNFFYRSLCGKLCQFTWKCRKYRFFHLFHCITLNPKRNLKKGSERFFVFL